MKLKYTTHGDELRAYVSSDEYYSTNGDGDGLFHVIISRNARHQLIGTCDFTIRGLTPASAKAKLRKAIPHDA